MPYQTRWLDDEEQELWRLLLAAVRKIDRGMDETLKAGGEVSASEFAVLVALSEAPEQRLRLRDADTLEITGPDGLQLQRVRCAR